ncbi:formate dehydrogenase accessory sulfurtransferase FdhD [Salibacterium salarium]|uniref:Sulfur carrier protein FdhD n=1 Tax=Salibacterium salarium TaxID=284579 RepID=A0A3R9P3E4_9BACI|nr:formate dehydrogenase accessory sulfurtransferase FdhD [Salibacterium salarium]
MSLKKPISSYRNGTFQNVYDDVVTEVPLTIFINNEEFATMVCSPFHFKELVVGFLFSEGVILFKKDIKSLDMDEDKGFAYVQLTKQLVHNQSFYSKRFIGSCCGKSRQFYFHSDVKTAKTSMTDASLSADQCIQLMENLQQNSDVFKETGGVHNAAVCSHSEIFVNRADIGRHNALDKLYGYCLLNNISVRDKMLVFSGRLSSEVLTKASKIGVGIVLSKSAPTDLAVKLAEDLNITAVGFIRGSSFNIYSHSHRITQNEKGDTTMGSCNIDHSEESVREKLESQKSYLPVSLYQNCKNILNENLHQDTLNEVFHLLKKYDLADEAEQQDRNKKLSTLVE